MKQLRGDRKVTGRNAESMYDALNKYGHNLLERARQAASEACSAQPRGKAISGSPADDATFATPREALPGCIPAAGAAASATSATTNAATRRIAVEPRVAK